MSFKDRFLRAETSFLAALSSGKAALAEFEPQWDALQADFEQAITHSALDSTEVEMAYSVASRIAILSDSFLKLEEVTADRTATMLAEMDVALSNLTLQDTPMVPSAAVRQRTVPYISAPFSWLLNNLHDPYPSTSLKRAWARDAQVSLRVMDDWFKSVRKEIGWVAFTQAHFRGLRSMATAAASSVLLDDRSNPPVPFEVEADLLVIKTKLENLYPQERGLAVGSSMHSAHRRSRALSVSSSHTDLAASSRSSSPTLQTDSSSDDISIASSSPASRASSRLPSLVFDQSDSEEDEQLPEFSTPGLLDDVAIRVTDFVKDHDTSERQSKRRRHSYYDLSVGDLPSTWPVDPFAQLIDSHTILPNDLAAHSDFWSFMLEENSSPEASTTASIDVIPTVDNVSASPAVAASTSRKRCHEDAELETPASKKSRVTRSMPRPNPRKEQKAIGATPVLVANVPPAPLEEPIVIDWEQLLKDLEKATSNTDGGSFDVTGPVDCNVFDFAALEPTTSTSPSNVDDLWDKLFSADVPGLNSAPTDDELFASFTNVDTLAGPDFPASADVSTVSIELPLALSSDLGLGTELTSELSTYELYSSTTLPLAQAGEPEVSSLCSGSDNTTQLAIPDSTEASPSIFDVLSRLGSGGSFDTYSPPLVAF